MVTLPFCRTPTYGQSSHERWIIGLSVPLENGVLAAPPGRGPAIQYCRHGGSYLGDGSVIATSKNFTLLRFCRLEVAEVPIADLVEAKHEQLIAMNRHEIVNSEMRELGDLSKAKFPMQGARG